MSEELLETLQKTTLGKELVGTRVYPKELTWKPLCPCCGKPIVVHLFWDQDACEFQINISCNKREGTKKIVEENPQK